MSTDETNDQMSETQFFFVFFNVFPRFKNRNNPMVCMLIFIFTFFLHEPKKFCALYYTNIVININSRVQTLIYFEKVNSSFWKAGTILQCFLRYYITRYFRVVKIVFVVKDRLVCHFQKKEQKFFLTPDSKMKAKVLKPLLLTFLLYTVL